VLQERFNRWRDRTIEEIQCPVKRREKTGEIVYKLAGEGTVMREWEEAIEKARSQVTRETQV
jgi:hypothetical protein